MVANHEFNQRLLARGLHSNWHGIILKEELKNQDKYYFAKEVLKIARYVLPSFSSDLESVLAKTQKTSYVKGQNDQQFVDQRVDEH